MAKKNTTKQARLDARAAQIQAQVAAERRRTYLIIAVFAVLVIGGAGLLYFLTNPPSIGGSKASSAVKKVGGVQTIADEGRGHVTRPERVTYKHQPPSSGQHYNDSGAPRPWGAVQTALLPEEYVHNLEHGGIVLVYQCSGSECDSDFQAAQSLFSQLPKEPAFNEVKFLSTPYQDMKPQAALLAWDHEQDFTGIPSLSDATAFYQQFVDQAPEKAQ